MRGTLGGQMGVKWAKTIAHLAKNSDMKLYTFSYEKFDGETFSQALNVEVLT